jgi:hypothetical protein
MKKFLQLLILSIAAILNSCSKDDDVPSRVIFTFEAGTTSSNADIWIVLHDNETGDLIDSKQIFQNSTTTFESTKKISSGKLAVTFFDGSNSPVGYSSANVYTDVDLGSKWYRDYSNAVNQKDPVDGVYTLTVNNLPSVYSFTLSDAEGPTSGLTAPPPVNGSVMTSGEFRSGLKELVSIDPGVGNPKYTELTGLTDGQSLTMSYNDFKDFDKYIKVTFPENGEIYTEIRGGYKKFDNDLSGYVFHYSSYDYKGPKRTELNIGLLNSVSNYYINLGISGWYYASQGPPPTSITYVNPDDFIMSGNTLEEFKIVKKDDYVFSSIIFFNEAMTYNVAYHSLPGKENFIDPLTKDIESKYAVDKTGFHLYEGYFEVKGRSLSEFIRSTFDKSYDPNTPFEISSVQAFRN